MIVPLDCFNSLGLWIKFIIDLWKKTCIFHSKILDKYFDQEKKKRGDRLSFQQFNQYGLVKTGEGMGEKKRPVAKWIIICYSSSQFIIQNDS